MTARLTRVRLLAAVGIVAVLNALVPRMIPSWNHGFWHALSDTFGVSAIVWLSVAVIFLLALAPSEGSTPDGQASPADLLIAGAAFTLSLIPAAPLAAGAVLVLAVWAVLTARGDRQLRGLGLIFLALTLTLFWGPLVLRIVPEVLEADAQLAAWALGSQAQGNIYSSVDGSRHFLVLSGCSSIKNISLATILAVTLSQYLRVKIDPAIGLAILVASVATVAVNVGRLAIMAARPAEFQYWHAGFGATIFGWLSLAAVCGIIGVAIARQLPHAAN